MSEDAEASHSLWFATALLPSGWQKNVRIEMLHGRIERIDVNVLHERRDERHAIGIPGARNVHSHAFQRALAGLTEHRRGSDSFWSWREAMYAFVQKLDADQIEAIATQAYCEMLESGITRVGEFHYLHHAPDGSRYSDIAEHAARLVEAANATGIGLTALPVLYAHGGVGGAPPQTMQRRFVNSLDTYARLLERARELVRVLPFGRVGIAAHSLRAVTPEELQMLLALPNDGPIHIHIAEQVAEIEQWLAFTGERPVEWLLDHARVDARWCLVHATHITDAELQAIVASRATVGLCPITEANLGDGLFPAKRFVELHGRFGIGTDSNVLIDFAEELRTLEYGQRLVHRERNVLRGPSEHSTGRTLFQGALDGGSMALGESNGALQVGNIADIVSLNDTHVSSRARSADAWLDSWIFAGAPMIDCVWAGGRKVVSAGRHMHRENITSRYAQCLDRLMQ